MEPLTPMVQSLVLGRLLWNPKTIQNQFFQMFILSYPEPSPTRLWPSTSQLTGIFLCDRCLTRVQVLGLLLVNWVIWTDYLTSVSSAINRHGKTNLKNSSKALSTWLLEALDQLGPPVLPKHPCFPECAGLPVCKGYRGASEGRA